MRRPKRLLSPAHATTRKGKELELTAEVRSGDPAEAIVGGGARTATSSLSARLKQGALAAFFRGSTTLDIVREAEVPVLAAPLGLPLSSRPPAEVIDASHGCTAIRLSLVAKQHTKRVRSSSLPSLSTSSIV